MAEDKVYSINQVRAYFDLNPVETGDDHYIQLDLQAVVDAAAAGHAGIVASRSSVGDKP